MTNAEINKKFLAAVDAKSKDMILTAIAKLYGYRGSAEEIYEELVSPSAKNVLDYMVGSERSDAYILYLRHGFKR